MNLEQKFGKLKPEYKTNENVVHNLSSRKLTEQELRVLSREANFNTADAKPAEFIAALEAMLVRTNATDEAKHTVRQKVTSLLLTNRPINNMSPAVIEAMKELKMDKDIIVLPADKGRATVVMNRVDYNEKAQALLDDQQSYPLSQVATHTLEEGHEFNFASTRIVARANNKTGRELLEAWVSDTNSINRHVDIPPCYHALRSRGQEARPNFQPRVHAVTPP
ncbi:hypothetical protein SprV_0802589300 [Sparganum proliferum]